MERELILTAEYREFMDKSSARVKAKLEYLANYLMTEPVFAQKFVKKLINTPFYELRVSVENEIRIILFSIGHDNINQAEQIIMLHGFVKKGTKDYTKEIKKALNILSSMI